MNDLIPTPRGDTLAVKTTSSLVARGLSRLGELPQKDLDFEMGHNHWEGINGYEQSDALAIEYFKKSAAKNNYEAMCDLAMLTGYHLTCGCQHDEKHICGLEESEQCEAYENRMTEAVGWLHKAALAGHPRAQCELPGSWCYCDDGTECGEISCRLDKFGWLEKAAAQNYPPALMSMALDKQPERAALYLEQLEQSDANHPEYASTISELADLHIDGRGNWRYGWIKEGVLKKDIKKGVTLHLKAAKLGCYSSQMALARLFTENKICVPHPVLAFNCCCKAILSMKGKGTEAALLLASFYENGVGTPVKVGLSIAILERLVALHPNRYTTPEITNKINDLKKKLTN